MVEKAEPTISTQVHDVNHMDMTNGTVSAGTPVHDQATVNGQVNGIAITGTVTYRFYINASCSGTPASNETVPVGTESTPQTLAPGSYSYDAVYSGDANYNASDSDCEPFQVIQKSIVTDTQLCTFDFDPNTDGSQFRLIFTPGLDGWKLNASNPGQFYYNVFFNDGTGPTTIYLTLPYPWVTQGATPIHAYSGVTTTKVDARTCLTPGDEIGHQTDQVTLSTYTDTNGNGSVGFGDTVTVAVTFQSPTGFAYVNIHVDYGLKGTTGWTKGINNAAQNSGGLPTIPDFQSYAFSFTDGISDSATVQSTNVFKRDPGVAGLILNSAGDPVPNVQVQIYLNGKLLRTVDTDEDGWYMWQYKYTGKPATFTVKLPTYSLAQSGTLKSNGFVVVSFTVP